ncbi:MAG: hypothetical protein HYU36_19710 [Planctomycetes bacterium]|nr:hypothetical protein [Planctomycetota bacterium]
MNPSAKDAASRSSALEAWVQGARPKLSENRLCQGDLDELQAIAAARGKKIRQRLLYLHAQTPSIASGLIAAALHEPIEGGVQQIDPGAPDLPYRNVHDAIRDGWQVIHFPLQTAPFDDREIDILGYEFILQKLEEYNA